MPGTSGLDAENICGPLASADCQLGDDQTLTITDVSPDFVHIPTLLATQPVPIAAPDAVSLQQHARNAARIPAPPLNLQHAVLLI